VFDCICGDRVGSNFGLYKPILDKIITLNAFTSHCSPKYSSQQAIERPDENHWYAKKKLKTISETGKDNNKVEAYQKIL